MDRTAAPAPSIRHVAGYSGTPLAKKLGIREGSRVALLAAPDGLAEALEPLPPAVMLLRQARAPLDVVLLFATRRAEIERRVPELARRLDPAGGLWTCFPKRASGVATDVTDHVLREIILPLGLVDNKVCAVDDTFTGVRFVWRRELRSQRA
jgi:hypothetical protein